MHERNIFSPRVMKALVSSAHHNSPSSLSPSVSANFPEGNNTILSPLPLYEVYQGGIANHKYLK